MSKVCAAFICRKPVFDHPAVELLNYAFQSFFKMFVRSINILITGQQMEHYKSQVGATGMNPAYRYSICLIATFCRGFVDKNHTVFISFIDTFAF
jgi:hypothetical protein